jgi:ribosomal protein L35
MELKAYIEHVAKNKEGKNERNCEKGKMVLKGLKESKRKKNLKKVIPESFSSI